MPVEVREGYLEIREVATREVIIVIEVLSPTNKHPGRGRKIYQDKRQSILGSQTHLIKIDLLRSGEPMPITGAVSCSHYRILVSRSDRRSRAELYAFNLHDVIPTFNLPLVTDSAEPVIDLHTLLDRIYDRAGYTVAIDDQSNPIPPLDTEDTEWMNVILQTQRLR